MRMGFEYLNPEKKWTWEELDKLTGHVPGLTTWMMKAYIETSKLGYDVIIYDPLDYAAFVKDPKAYISKKFSKEYADVTFEMSDMKRVVTDAKALLEQQDLLLYPKNYTLEEYKKLLDEKYLCITWVDMAITNGLKGGCVPHVILAYGYDRAGIHAHDPGYIDPDSRQPHRFISWELFEKANKMNAQGECGEMLAFRLIERGNRQDAD